MVVLHSLQHSSKYFLFLVKKDTLKLQKFEDNLLLYYKKFLQKLEKYCFQLIKKRGDSRKRTEVSNNIFF